MIFALCFATCSYKSDILIVGLGLIGKSPAKAFKRLGYPVSAIDTRAEVFKNKRGILI